MGPINENQSAQTGQSTAQPSPTGVVGRLGSWLIGWAVAHTAPSLETRNLIVEKKNCGDLINNISDQITQKILGKVANTNFIVRDLAHGGSNHIRQAIQDLTQHIFTVLATKDIPNPENLTDDQLADNFIISILKTLQTEFTKPWVNAETHFMKERFLHIADQLLTEVFPEGIHDQKIPVAIRKLLSGDGLVQFAAQTMLGTNHNLTWDNLKSFFADYLEEIYESLTYAVEKPIKEADHPGVNQCIQSLKKIINEQSKQRRSIPLNFTWLNAESNKFIDKFLVRLLQGEFENAENQELIAGARQWSLNAIESLVRSLYLTIFTPVDGQSPEARRIQFAENILTQAGQVLPRTMREIEIIRQMEEEDVKEKILTCIQMYEDDIKAKITGFLQDPQKAAHHADLTRALAKVTNASMANKEDCLSEAKELLTTIEPFLSLIKSFHRPELKEVLEKMTHGSEEEKAEGFEQGRELLKAMEVFFALESVMQKELDPAKIKQLLPSFISAKTASDLLYASLVPYTTEILMQCEDIHNRGADSKRALTAHGETGMAVWIDQAFNVARGLLEKKALANTLQPTRFQFINGLLSHIVKSNNLEAKNYINLLLKDIVTILAENAVAGDIDNQEKAIADILNKVLKKGTEKIQELIAAEHLPSEMKIIRSIKLAERLDTKLEPDALDDEEILLAIEEEPGAVGEMGALTAIKKHKLTATYEKLFLRNTSREILESVVSKKLFNEILPPFLRTSGIWELVADYFSDYFQGVYEQTKKMQQNITSDKKKMEEGIVSENEGMIVKVPEVQASLQSLTDKILIKMTAPAEGTPPAEESSLERLFRHLMQGEGMQNVCKNALPKVIEAILAHHVNPVDALTAEQRAANLFMEFLSKAQEGFDKVDRYLAVEDKDKAGWLENNGYTKEVMQEYRKRYDIPENERLDVRRFLLQEASDNLLAKLLPQDLFGKLIPKEFAAFRMDRLLADYAYDYIKDAYEFSRTMQQLALTENEDQIKMLKELESYLATQIHEFMSCPNSNEKTWVEKVARAIFQSKDAAHQELLRKLTTNVYCGAIGYVFKKAAGGAGKPEDDNLLTRFAPILARAQEAFIILNNEEDDSAVKRAKLNISDDELRNYLKASGKPLDTDVSTLDIAHLIYWVAGRRALETLFTDEAWTTFLPEFLRTMFTKDAAANFVTKIYETVHQTQLLLQEQEAVGHTLVQKEPGLKKFVDEYLIDNFKDVLKELGEADEALDPSLPVLLDTFLKDCCKDESTDVGAIRDTVNRRLIYTMVGKLLRDGEAPVISKVCALLRKFKLGDNQATARFLLETVLPKEISDTPLAKVVISEGIANLVADLIAQINQSKNEILKQGGKAKVYLDALPGMKPFVHDMMAGLDSSLKELAEDATVQISDDLPPYVDNLLKEAILNKELQPVIEEALHNMIYIIMEQVLTPKKGQTVENRALEVGAALIELHNGSPDSQKIGEEWLKLLLPQTKLNELLPQFLRKTITHEKLVDWFFKPYVDQVVAQKDRVLKANALDLKNPNNNVSRAQDYVKKLLLSYTKQGAPLGGLLNFQGDVREIERAVLGTLGDPAHNIHKPAEAYVNALVSQIIRSPEIESRLSPHFLSEALIASLGLLDDATPFHLTAEEFPKAASNILMKMIFPDGHQGLLVPEVAQKIVWEKTSRVVEGHIKEITDSGSRIFWVLDRLIPLTTDNEEMIARRRQEVENLRPKEGVEPDPKLAEKAESLFKRYTLDVAMHQVDLRMQKSTLWAPIRWLLGMIAKAVTYLAVRFSLRHRIYSFVADKKSDEKFRKIIWSILNFATPPARDGKEIEKDLKGKMRTALQSTSLVPAPLRGLFSSQIAAYLADKNIVDLFSDQPK